MKRFFSTLLAVVLGLFVFFGLGFAIFAGIGAAFSSSKKTEIKDKSILILDLNRPVVERASKDPFANLPFPGASEKATDLGELKKAIKLAAKNDKVKGIAIRCEIWTGGLALLEDLRRELQAFKDSSGKFIVSYGEYYTEGAYYLASVSDKIILNPAGALEFNGLNMTTMFFKGTLEKLEVKPEVFKVGQFKSAVEPFLLDKMSEPNRLQVTSFLGSIYDNMITNISKSRNISQADLRLIADSMKVQSPDDALKYRLVTHVAYGDQTEDTLKALSGTEAKDKINYVTVSEINKVGKKDKDKKIKKLEKNKIAIVYAVGEIGMGNTTDDQIGPDLSKTIRKIRKDSTIKAVVLRVNSPGGSALASDVIWREVELLAKEKTVIASMSNLAASGGYYISMAADSIFAEPTTLTGSIGVFGLMFNAQGLLTNKMGLTFDGVKTSHYADLGAGYRPTTDGERMIIQNSVNRIYEEFTSKAAQGRGMNVDTLKSYAEGRVWTGTQAKKIGLVDEIGGLDDAIAAAAKVAGLGDSYRLVNYPEEKDFWKDFVKGLETKTEAYVMEKYLGADWKMYKEAAKLKEKNGIMAWYPYQFTIQ